MFQRQAAMARSFGIDVDLLTPREALDKWPLLRSEDLQGALWFPADGKANPADLAQSLAKGARNLGVKMFEGTRMLGVQLENGFVKAVETTHRRRSSAKSSSIARGNGRARSARRAASASRCILPSTSTSSPSRSPACTRTCR